jgi:hypothetical protein
MNFWNNQIKGGIMCVYYRNERWKIINQPVRDSLLVDLKVSDPGKRITIQNCCDSRKQEIVKLGSVSLDL